MGQDDNLHASLAHLVLCCMGGNGLSKLSPKCFTHPGMHANFFIHGVLGFLSYQSGTFGDLAAAYALSMKATKYLALPCLMADLWRSNPLNSNENLSMIHLVSGLVPFVLALAGKDNAELGHIVVAANTVSLAYWSFKNEKEWGYYTTAAALLAYFLGTRGSPIIYPLALALMEYCSIRLYYWEPPQQGRRR